MSASAMMKTFQESAEKQYKSIIDNAPSTIAAWDDDFAKFFPHATLSAAAESFEKDGNGSVASALSATVNLIDKVSSDLALAERFITLTIPQMEDGNNFGVTVQLSALKLITDARESILTKAVEDLAGYSHSRAEALEKCKLPSTSVTETETTSESNSKENSEEKVTKSSSKESKSVNTKTESSPLLTVRQQAVVAVDLVYYSKAKTAYSKALTAYLAALDFCEKNTKKISKPKGTQGGHSSMY